MNKNTVIEAEFVELGKHQKVSTVVETMDLLDAKIAMSVWWQTKTHPKIFNKSAEKEIRSRLRSFGWYIVKTKAGYKLMEEIDLVEAEKQGFDCAIALASINEEIDEPYECRTIQSYGFHIVWVPSFQKRLVMRDHPLDGKI